MRFGKELSPEQS